MAHPYRNISPLNCWKGYERVPGKAPGTKGSCRKSSPAKATKGGGTTKVCLPKSKVNNMSEEQKQKVVRAKESAGRSGKRERSQQSEVRGARKKGATLKDWFEKENWINVKTGQECGAPTKMDAKWANRDPGTNMTQKEKLENRDLYKKRNKGGYNIIKSYLDWDGDDKIEPWEIGAEAATWLVGGPVAKGILKGAGKGFKFLKGALKRKESNEPRKTTKGKGRNFRTVEEGAGMTEEGVKEYKKKNPGSNLQTAVTGPVSELSEKEKARRRSFCARSKGWTGERGKAARKRWRC